MDYAILAIVWTCVLLFVITAAITVLALLNVVTLGGSPSAHQYYLRTLFKTLVVEMVVISLGTFAVATNNRAANTANRADNTAIGGILTTTLEGHETRIRLLEKSLLEK
jgi:predicted secreted protein